MTPRKSGLAKVAGFLFAIAAPLSTQAQAPPDPQNPKSFYDFVRGRMNDDPQGTRDALRTSTFSPQGSAMPANEAALSAMLTKRQYQELFDTLLATNSFEGVSRNLDWERLEIYEGAGLPIAIAYMRDLWRISEAVDAKERDGLRQSAVGVALYAYALTSVDGVRCEDAEAPLFRRQQLFVEYPFLWSYAKGMPKISRNAAMTMALVFEASTGPARRDDSLLCLGRRTGSMLEMSEGLLALAQAGEEPKRADRPDHVGQGYEVPRAPPKFVKPDQWMPLQTPLREALPDVLAQVVSRGKPLDVGK